ncbi:hypothetical protein PTKU15_12160 [Paraburkholderia terrae]|nr:hypothetical protein PTKU15_12160 [Paraburkholderia terrae]
MADTFTAYYNLTKPEVGGSPDTWGTKINTDMDQLDTAIHNVQVGSVQVSSGGPIMLSGALDIVVNGTDNGTVLTSKAGLGRLLAVKVFTANGTYTPTPGTSFAIVEGCGGGGGGGGSAQSNIAGSGAYAGTGGGGAFGRVLWQNPTSQTVTIGAAGAGGAAGGAVGGAGGQTSIGTILVCPGGAGGKAGTNQSFQGTVLVIDGGVGGAIATTSATPLFLSAGLHGEPQLSHYNGSAVQMGYGGNSPYGIGGNVIHNGPTGYGAGGGAYTPYQTASAIAGVPGTAGILFVYEYSV